MPAEDQIGGWLTAAEKAAFEAYLDRLGIRPAAGATLLIARELKCKRLPKLQERFEQSAGADRKRVTARPSNFGLKAAFEGHVLALKIAPDPAASILFRAELSERWLERALELESS